MLFNKSLLPILNSPDKLKIISFLLDNDAQMSEREMSRVLDVSHMSVNRTMDELASLNFAHSSRIGRARVWKVNRSSYAFLLFTKVLESCLKVGEPLDDLKKTIIETLPLEFIKKITLFGSITRKAERSGGDIELLILVNNDSALAALTPALEELSSHCLDRFGNALSPHVLTPDQLQEKNGLKMLSEMESGIVFYERSERITPKIEPQEADQTLSANLL